MNRKSRLSSSGRKPRSSRLKAESLGVTSGGWVAEVKKHFHPAHGEIVSYTWEKRGIDSGLLIVLGEAWLGKDNRQGYLVSLKEFTPVAGGHRMVGETIKQLKSTNIQTALNQASELMVYADKLKKQPKTGKFVWETPDKSWRWEATKYQGNGIFFGKVTSPYVPEGEWGTWYVWEVEQNAKLVSGDKEKLTEMKKKSERAQTLQKALLGGR